MYGPGLLDKIWNCVLSIGVSAGLGIALSQPAWALEPDTPLNAWLLRVHEASRHRAYTGTFVVSAGGSLASARISHVCDGAQQVERVEPLSGVPRATFRRNDQVVTLYPLSRVAVMETRESLGLFPTLLKSNDAAIGEFYNFKVLGTSRVAGLDADAIGLSPKDALRFGYRVWTEKQTGLVVQMQTLDAKGAVIEQSAFSELQLDAPVKMAQLIAQMENTAGYRISKPTTQVASPQALGWALSIPVAGFKSAGCVSRTLGDEKQNTTNVPANQPNTSISNATSGAAAPTLQCLFTDGLATVSLFIEPFDPLRHQRQGAAGLGGATHVVAQRLGDWWAIAVGEVPVSTLGAFAFALERKK